MKSALSLVDGVHGGDALPTVHFDVDTLGMDAAGEFRPDKTPWEIRLDPRYEPQMMYAVVHEIGHWIDYGALDNGRQRGTGIALQGSMQGWWNAVKHSREVEGLYQVRGDKDDLEYIRKYLLSPQELWARSYAQYIGTKTQNAELLGTITEPMLSSGYERWSFWSDEEFALIGEQIEDLLKGLKWLRK
jgi:hypothetical protein